MIFIIIIIAMDDIIVDDQQLTTLIEENLDEYKIDNTIPNYVTSGNDDIENTLKTEIHICSQCMHPDIIGTQPFNRRVKELKQMKIDSIVFAALTNFANKNGIDKNAAISLLLRIADNPDVHKMLMGSFSVIPRRKGKQFRSSHLLENDA